MISPIDFAIFFIGIIGGFLDSTVGFGGLVIIPSLALLGIPLPVAIATDRFGSVGFSLGAFLKYIRTSKILWKYVPIFSIFGLLGSYLGANLLVSISTKHFETVIGIILLCMIPLILFKQSIGIEHKNPSNIRRIFGFFIDFIIMIYSGFFGIGAGPLSTYNSLFMFGFTIIESNATKIIPWFLLSLSSLVIFSRHGIVNIQYGIVLFVGMAIGGYLGAHVAISKGDKWLKRLFVVFVALSAIKFLLF